MMDLGFGRFLEMFEDRFGRHPTTGLIILIALALAAVCVHLIWQYLVKPVIGIIPSAMPQISMPEITISTLFYLSAFTAFTVTMIPLFGILGSQRRVPQRAVDRLAELRSEAIHDILNAIVTTAAELAAWEARDEQWSNDVLAILRQHFSRAEELAFDRRGVIPLVQLPHAFNNQHQFRLQVFVKSLTTLEDIIARHTR